MTHESAQAAAAVAAETTPPAANEMARAAPAPVAAPQDTAPAAPQETRAAATPAMSAIEALDVIELGQALGHRAIAERAVREGKSKETAIAAIMAARAQANEAAALIGGPRVSIGRDETETRRRAMEDAMAIQMGERKEPNEPARGFMEMRSIVSFAAEMIGHRGRLESPAEREDVLRRAMTTSDFPILTENAFNRVLLSRYPVAPATYRNIAQQRQYRDFNPHASVRAGDFPTLKPVNEAGEIKIGTFSESKETTQVKNYGVVVPFSRQLLINDNLGAIQTVLNAQADAVVRFEEVTFYAMMLSASGAGPTLNTTSRAVFNTTDKTLASSGTVIDNANLGKGRAVLRKMKSLDGQTLNLTPAILLVGPDKETEAQGVLSPLYAAQAANVNLFGNILRLVVSSEITGNAWYLFTDPSVGANFEWGLLDGYQAPRMRIEEPFGMQGMSVSLEHDFGCGAIDFRFGYQNPGA